LSNVSLFSELQENKSLREKDKERIHECEDFEDEISGSEIEK
jgi:hypothetical protein